MIGSLENFLLQCVAPHSQAPVRHISSTISNPYTLLCSSMTIRVISETVCSNSVTAVQYAGRWWCMLLPSCCGLAVAWQIPSCIITTKQLLFFLKQFSPLKITIKFLFACNLEWTEIEFILLQWIHLENKISPPLTASICFPVADYFLSYLKCFWTVILNKLISKQKCFLFNNISRTGKNAVVVRRKCTPACFHHSKD